MFAPPCQVKQTGQEPVRAPEKAHSAKELVPPRVAKPIVKSRGLSQRVTIKSSFVKKSKQSENDCKVCGEKYQKRTDNRRYGR